LIRKFQQENQNVTPDVIVLHPTDWSILVSNYTEDHLNSYPADKPKYQEFTLIRSFDVKLNKPLLLFTGKKLWYPLYHPTTQSVPKVRKLVETPINYGRIRNKP
jgi:hypothetical protein